MKVAILGPRGTFSEEAAFIASKLTKHISFQEALYLHGL